MEERTPTSREDRLAISGAIAPQRAKRSSEAEPGWRSGRSRKAILGAGVGLLAATAAYAAVMAADPAHPPTAGLDRWWLRVVTSWQATPLTRAGEVLSYVAGPWGGTVVVGIAVAWLLWRRRIGAAVFLALTEACGSGASQLIKHLVIRPRPPHPLVRADFGSFPSGHVITTIVVGLGLVAVFSRPGRRSRPLIGVAIAALAMIFVRTYLRAHWLADTFESVLAGTGIALVLWALFAPDKMSPGSQGATGSAGRAEPT